MSGHGLTEVAAAGGTFVAAGLAWLWRKGTFKEWRERRSGDKNRNGKSLERIEDISLDTYKKVSDLENEVKDVGDKVDAVGETVFLLHEDDPDVSDVSALRDTLDVDDLPDDFMRGGGTSDPEG